MGWRWVGGGIKVAGLEMGGTLAERMGCEMGEEEMAEGGIGSYWVWSAVEGGTGDWVGGS